MVSYANNKQREGETVYFSLQDPVRVYHCREVTEAGAWSSQSRHVYSQKQREARMRAQRSANTIQGPKQGSGATYSQVCSSRTNDDNQDPKGQGFLMESLFPVILATTSLSYHSLLPLKRRHRSVLDLKT